MIHLEDRYRSVQLDLEGKFSLLSFQGKDAEGFLSGQLTSNVLALGEGCFHPTARIERTGGILGYGYLIKRNGEDIVLLTEREFARPLKEDLDRYIVMEGVSIFPLDTPFSVEWSPGRGLSQGYFWGEEARILLGEKSTLPLLSKDMMHTIRRLNGYPLAQDIPQKKLINETYLNHVAVDYDKGCFLGQETVAKIHNNRGGATFPVLLQVDKPLGQVQGDIFCGNQKFGFLRGQITIQGHTFLEASVKRAFRVKNKSFSLKIGPESVEARLLYLPLFPDITLGQKARELFSRAIEEFKGGQEEGALSLLERVISWDPTFPDAYESLGVILGRRGCYEEAIQWMDKLLKLDPSSVMAHTNKSLYFMRMGKIKEAEEEKSLATVASFQQLGNEAQRKERTEEKRKQEEGEMAKREEMFREVLAMDPEDVIANFGLGEIAFKRKEYTRALHSLEGVLKKDETYSRAYLLLGQALEALGQRTRARDVYERGIIVASKKGDMMPANEMQEKLSNIQ